MSNVPCNGCTQCCMWGSQAHLIKVDPNIRVTEEGHCIHLVPGKGCKLYGKPERPVKCMNFTCLDTLAESFAEPKTHPLTAVIVAAARLEARLETEYAAKMPKKEKGKNGDR